jgi:integrase
VRLTRQLQADRRTAKWPKVCICGERHQLLFTTSTGHPLEPRNVKRSFDSRRKKGEVRQIKIHETRRTCGSLLAALDVHPRIAMAVLRHSRVAMTMEIYTQAPDKAIRDALKRLIDLFGFVPADETAAPADKPEDADEPGGDQAKPE